MKGLDAELANFFHNALSDGFIAHHAVGDVFPPGFKLRFDEGDNLAAGRQAGGHGRENELEGDKGNVGYAKVRLFGQIFGGEIPAVKLFFAPHTRIAPQAVMQLVGADIKGEHPPGVMLKQAVGEAAGGGADIKTA